MDSGEINFPKFTPYHVAFVTPRLEEALAAFGRIYGNPEFSVVRQAAIQTPQGLAYVDFGLADLNGLRVEVIEPAGGHDRVYREALPVTLGETRFHHVASTIHSQQDWDQVIATIERNGLETPIGGSAQTPEGLLYYVYVDTRRQLGHYLEFVYNAGPHERMIQEREMT